MSDALTIKHVTRTEWDETAPQFRDLSYRQCGAYAEAAARDVGATSEFIAFFRAEELVALSNVRVKKVPFSPFGIAYVNYGPLTARSNDFSPSLFGSCLDALKKEYVENRRLIVRVVPPTRGGTALEAQARCLESKGFKFLLPYKQYETFILDLERPMDEIRKNFDGKWRSDLAKAQRSNIEVTRSVIRLIFVALSRCSSTSLSARILQPAKTSLSSATFRKERMRRSNWSHISRGTVAN